MKSCDQWDTAIEQTRDLILRGRITRRAVIRAKAKYCRLNDGHFLEAQCLLAWAVFHGDITRNTYEKAMATLGELPTHILTRPVAELYVVHHLLMQLSNIAEAAKIMQQEASHA